MKYLLDTHALIWYFENAPELSSISKEIIAFSKNEIYICTISLFEIVVKINIGKLELGFSFDKLINDIENRTFNVLQMENKYLIKYLTLPFIHKDPFDRFIIATALAEDLTIITIDKNIQRYDVKWVW